MNRKGTIRAAITLSLCILSFFAGRRYAQREADIGLQGMSDDEYANRELFELLQGGAEFTGVYEHPLKDDEEIAIAFPSVWRNGKPFNDIVIHRSGKIRRYKHSGSFKEAELGMSAVNGLIARIKETGFLRISTDTIQVKVAVAAGTSSEPTHTLDASTTTIRMRYRDRIHEVQVYNLERLWEEFGYVRDVQVARNCRDLVIDIVPVELKEWARDR